LDAAIKILKPHQLDKIKHIVEVGPVNVTGIVFQVLFNMFNRGVSIPYTNTCCDIGRKVIKCNLVMNYKKMCEVTQATCDKPT
jgi:hypothetical protein